MRRLISVIVLLQEVNATANHNPINPKIKRTTKTIAAQILVSSGEDCLKKLTGLAFRASQAQGQSQDRGIIVSGKLGERVPATRLRLMDQQSLIRIVGTIGDKEVRRDGMRRPGTRRLTTPRFHTCL